MPNYPQYIPYLGDPYTYGVTGGEHNYFAQPPPPPPLPPGPGPALSNTDESGSNASNPNIQNTDDVYRGSTQVGGSGDVNIAYPSAPKDPANMTYDEYMQWVKSPQEEGRSLKDWIGLDALGILSNAGKRAGSTVAGVIGSAVGGIGGGLAGSGAYDAGSLYKQVQDARNAGFNPNIGFWDYMLAALPFITPEDRMNTKDWTPLPVNVPAPSEEELRKMGEGSWWDIVNDPSRNAPNPQNKIESESLPLPNIGGEGVPINPSFNAEDVWYQMGPGVPTTIPIETEILPSPPSTFASTMPPDTQLVQPSDFASVYESPIGPQQEEPSNYEQWSTPEDIFENYNPGETYGEYAGGGPAREHGNKVKTDKEFWMKYGKGILDRLADKMENLARAPNQTPETAMFDEMLQGPYSSKMAETWPEEYAPFRGNNMDDEFIGIITPDHYTEKNFAPGGPVGGGSVRGPGSGMDDMVPATVEGHQIAKLSNDEFVIPADVVSQIGDGSSDSGHRKLYDFISNIRQAKTGNPQQPPKLMEALKGLNAISRGKPQNTFISDVIKMKQAINPQREDNSYAAEYIRAIKSVMEAR